MGTKKKIGLPKGPNEMIIDPMGQWKYPGKNTRIPGNSISMDGVDPLWAVPNVGVPQFLNTNQSAVFPGADYVDEFPLPKAQTSLNLDREMVGTTSSTIPPADNLVAAFLDSSDAYKYGEAHKEYLLKSANKHVEELNDAMWYTSPYDRMMNGLYTLQDKSYEDYGVYDSEDPTVMQYIYQDRVRRYLREMDRKLTEGDEGERSSNSFWNKEGARTRGEDYHEEEFTNAGGPGTGNNVYGASWGPQGSGMANNLLFEEFIGKRTGQIMHPNEHRVVSTDHKMDDGHLLNFIHKRASLNQVGNQKFSADGYGDVDGVVGQYELYKKPTYPKPTTKIDTIWKTINPIPEIITPEIIESNEEITPTQLKTILEDVKTGSGKHTDRGQGLHQSENTWTYPDGVTRFVKPAELKRLQSLQPQKYGGGSLPKAQDAPPIFDLLLLLFHMLLLFLNLILPNL